MNLFIAAVLACVALWIAIRFRGNRGRTKPHEISSSFKTGKYGIEDLFALSAIHPDYHKTLAHLRDIQHPDVSFDGISLCFKNYPFEPATAYPSGKVEVDDVAEINLGYPSEVRLKCGDILFVPSGGKEALLEFVNKYDLQVVRRESIWDQLLEPFLDTAADQETIDRQFVRLADCGLHRDAVDQWRREVGVAMIAYNFGTNLWEWVHLGIYDVLVAQCARLSRPDFADFYSRALILAAREPVIPFPGYTSPGLTSTRQGLIESTLFSVLLDWYPRDTGGNSKDFRKRWDARQAQIERLKKSLASDLVAAYSESHRHYHTLAHIENCLSSLEKDYLHATHLNEVKWALLFHDAIYDTRRQDNEIQSADWACRVMDELERPEEEKIRVRNMILATTHTGAPSTPDAALMMDIDCAILGADATIFTEYDRAIRLEYDWVPEEQYRQARADVLESFTKRGHIFHTALYRQRCEQSARANIRESLERLRLPSPGIR